MRIRRFFRTPLRPQPPRLFHGPFETWQGAQAQAGTYEDDTIIASHVQATLAVIGGLGSYERDGQIVEGSTFDLGLVSALFWAAKSNSSALSVLDFGGALGGTYFRHRKLLELFPHVDWIVCETPQMVSAALQLPKQSNLRFETTSKELLEGNFDLVVMGSSLQYLQDPEGLIRHLSKSNGSAIWLDRVPMWSHLSSKIFVQKTPKGSYRASYPSWVFSEPDIRTWFEPTWTLVSGFNEGFRWATSAGDDVSWVSGLFVR